MKMKEPKRNATTKILLSTWTNVQIRMTKDKWMTFKLVQRSLELITCTMCHLSITKVNFKITSMNQRKDSNTNLYIPWTIYYWNQCRYENMFFVKKLLCFLLIWVLYRTKVLCWGIGGPKLDIDHARWTQPVQKELRLLCHTQTKGPSSDYD